MNRFRRIAAVGILVTGILAAAPTPASAAPWRDGFGEAAARVGRQVEWRLMSWLLRAMSRNTPGLTNVHAADGANIVP